MDTHRARPDRERLYALYHSEKKSLREIGELYGVKPVTVLRWMRKFDIPTRSISEATSLAQTGRPLSEAHKASLRIALDRAREMRTPESFARQAEKVRGRSPWIAGKKHTPEALAKIAASWTDPEARARRIAKMTGPNSPHWKGGVKSESARRLDTAEWRRLRVTIYERDNWTCQDCGKACKNTRDSKNDGGAKIQCHHIVSRRDGGTDDPANLVTLCMSCHHKRERTPKDGRTEP